MLCLQAQAELELRRRKGKYLSPEARYRAFGERYFHDFAGFLRDCVDWPEDNGRKGPAPYQLNIAEELIEYQREAVQGPHTLGKTCIASLAIHWFALTRDAMKLDWKALTTATGWQQLTLYLWPEVHKWARFLKWDKIGRQPYKEGSELQKLNIVLEYGAASAINSSDYIRMEGGHATQLLFVFDEAKGIIPGIYDAMEGAFSSAVEGSLQQVYVLAISTPGEPEGRFYQICSKEIGYQDWHVRQVTKDESIAAGRMSEKWATDRARQWTERSAEYINRVLGQFAQSGGTSLIPLQWVKDAMDRHAIWQASGRLRASGYPSLVTHIGADVGGGLPGNDHSTIALVYDGYIVGDLIDRPSAEDPSIALMELGALLKALYLQYRPRYITVDGLGIGAGVVQWLRSEGIPCIAFMAGNGTSLLDASGLFGFVNWRAAAWWGLREALDPGTEIPLILPPDEELQRELLAMRPKGVNMRNQRMVEQKDDVIKRLGHSTDRSDAILHAIYGPILLANAEQEEEKETTYVVTPHNYRIGNY